MYCARVLVYACLLFFGYRCFFNNDNLIMSWKKKERQRTNLGSTGHVRRLPILPWKHPNHLDTSTENRVKLHLGNHCEKKVLQNEKKVVSASGNRESEIRSYRWSTGTFISFQKFNNFFFNLKNIRYLKRVSEKYQSTGIYQPKKYDNGNMT